VVFVVGEEQHPIRDLDQERIGSELPPDPGHDVADQVGLVSSEGEGDQNGEQGER